MNKKTIKKAVELYCNLAGIKYFLRFGEIYLTPDNYNRVSGAFLASYGLLTSVKQDFYKLINNIQ